MRDRALWSAGLAVAALLVATLLWESLIIGAVCCGLGGMPGRGST